MREKTSKGPAKSSTSTLSKIRMPTLHLPSIPPSEALDPDDPVPAGSRIIARAYRETQAHFAAARIEDVAAVARTAEPGLQGFFGRRSAVDDVLADPGAVAARLRRAEGSGPRATDARSRSAEHVLRVLLGHPVEEGIGRERRQPRTPSDVVDSGQHLGRDPRRSSSLAVAPAK